MKKTDGTSMQFTAIYDPHSLSEADFKKSFVARQELLKCFEGRLKQNRKSGGHELILGARGMGKTSLLRRISLAVAEEPELEKAWIPICFREEQYNVRQLRFFWQNSCDAFAQWCEDRGDMDNATELDDLRENRVLDAGEIWRRLEQFCNQYQRRLILLVDNLDLILENLSDKDQWSLRKVLSKRNGPLMLAASSAPIRSLSDRDKPFYDFFHLLELESLTEPELRQCLVNIARHRGVPGKQVIKDLDRNPQRLKILHTYTDGNPRTLILMYRVLESICTLDETGPDDFMPLLSSMVEAVTPLYKAKTEEFSQQQRQILDALALNWDPMTPAAVAEHTAIAPTALPAQLKRLKSDGILEDVTLSGGKAALQLRERFYNIWYLMRNGSRRNRRRLVFLTRSIQDLFSVAEIERFSRKLLGNKSIDPQFGLALADIVNNPVQRELLYKTRDSMTAEPIEYLRIELREAFGSLGMQNLAEGEYQSAVEDFSEALTGMESPMEQSRILIARGMANKKMSNFDMAIADFSAVVDMEHAPAHHRALAFYDLGCSRTELGDLEGAQANFTSLLDWEDVSTELRSLALYNLGCVRSDRGDLDAAIADFTLALELELDNVPAEQFASTLRNRGYVKWQQGDLDGAVADYTSVVELSNVSAEQPVLAFFNRAYVKIQQGDLDAAIVDYTAVVNLEGVSTYRWAEALYCRGFLNELRANLEAALSDYSEIVASGNATSSQHCRAGYRIGSIFLDHFRDYSRAKQAFEKACHEGLETEERLLAIANLSWLHIFSEDLQAAEALMAELNELEPPELDLLNSALELSRDNFGSSFDLLQQILDESSESLWSMFKDDLLRLTRIFVGRGFGDKLLHSLEVTGFHIKQAPYFYAVQAFVGGEQCLRNINPETAKLARPLYQWLASGANREADDKHGKT